MPNIDLDDLQANTVYTGYQKGSKNIVWFWATLRELSEQDRAKFLQFVTGTSKVCVRVCDATRSANMLRCDAMRCDAMQYNPMDVCYAMEWN